MRISDWSSDVCSSDLHAAEQKKSSFALEHAIESTAWRTPRYIAEGLRWLAKGNPAPMLPPDAVRSEEHTSELQSLMRISYAVFCLKKKKTNTPPAQTQNQYTNIETCRINYHRTSQGKHIKRDNAVHSHIYYR